MTKPETSSNKAATPSTNAQLTTTPRTDDSINVLDALNNELVRDCMQESKRLNTRNFRPWNNQAEFTLVAINTVIGIGNVGYFVFPLARTGFSFFFQYFITILLIMQPAIQMEIALAQYFRFDVTEFYSNACPLLAFVGYLLVIGNFIDMCNYWHVIARCLWYTYESLSSIVRNTDMPWENCVDKISHNTSCIICDINTLQITGKSKCHLYSTRPTKLTSEETYEVLTRHAKMSQPEVLYLFHKLYKIPLEHLATLSLDTLACKAMRKQTALHKVTINMPTKCGIAIYNVIEKTYSNELITMTILVGILIMASLWWGFSVWCRKTQYLSLLTSFFLLYICINIYSVNTVKSNPSSFYPEYARLNETIGESFKKLFMNVKSIKSWQHTVLSAIFSISASNGEMNLLGQRLQYDVYPLVPTLIIILFDISASILFFLIETQSLNIYSRMYNFAGPNKYSADEVLYTNLDYPNLENIFIIVPAILQSVNGMRDAFLSFIYFGCIFICGFTSLTISIEAIRTGLQKPLNHLLKQIRKAHGHNKTKKKTYINVLYRNADRFLLAIILIAMTVMSVFFYCNNYYVSYSQILPNYLVFFSSVAIICQCFVIVCFIGFKVWRKRLDEIYPSNQLSFVFQQLMSPNSIGGLIRYVVCILIISFLIVFQHIYLDNKNYWISPNPLYLFIAAFIINAIFQSIYLIAIKKLPWQNLYRSTAKFKPLKAYVLTKQEMIMFKHEITRQCNTINAMLSGGRRAVIVPSVDKKLRKKENSTTE